jgi:streptogramin lyase
MRNDRRPRAAVAERAPRRRRIVAGSVSLLATVLGVSALTATPASADTTVNGAISELAVGSNLPSDITRGPDGNLWFVNTSDKSIGRITNAGAISHFAPAGITNPSAITAGPDGNLWFVNSGSSVGRMTTAGALTTFNDPNISGAKRIAAGPDGNLWLTATGAIWRITPAGSFTGFSNAAISSPTGITAGPDGNLWFVNGGSNSIGRLTTAGGLTTFPGAPAGSGPAIVAGTDGNLWFTATGAIGRVTTAGVITSFPDASIVSPQSITALGSSLYFTKGSTTPTLGTIGRITTAGAFGSSFGLPTTGFVAGPDAVRILGMATGTDGNLWLTDTMNDAIDRMTPTGTVTQFGGIGQPTDLTPGPDGNLWFTNVRANSIGRVAPNGSGLTAFPVTTAADAHPTGITTGPDGNVWFTNDGNSSVGRITPAGAVTGVFPTGGQHPQHVTTGPDGNLWVTNLNDSSVSRVTPAGTSTRFRLPTQDFAGAITAGPDGNVWLVGGLTSAIYRVTPTGTITPFHDATISTPSGIAAGPDGNLWFTNAGNNSIGRITPSGTVSHFTGNTLSSPGDITAGPDGHLWFTNTGNNTIGRISPGGSDPVGSIVAYTGASVSGPTGIAAGPDGRIYFTNEHRDSIGVVVAGPGAPTDVHGFAGDSEVQVAWQAPVHTGGAAIAGYAVVASPGGRACLSSSTTCVVTGLTNGVAYTFTVFGVSTSGTGALSAPSSPVTPSTGHAGSFFHPLPPQRILDSRPVVQVGPYDEPWSAGETRPVTVAGAGGVPADATAVVLNVTVTEPTAASFLTIWPTGDVRPIASSLNWAPGQTIPNQVTVGVGTGGAVSVFNNAGTAHVIMDVAGYYRAGAGDGYTSVAPVRVLDSRPDGPQRGPYATPWGAGETRPVQVAGVGGVPADADAVALNITVTDTTAPSFLTAWSGVGDVPLVSNLNWVGGTVANATTVGVGANGSISIFNATGKADVIVDVVGYFTAGSGKAFHPVSQTRIADSRPATQVGPFATPWSSLQTRTVPVDTGGAVPPDADAVAANVTATDTTDASFLTIWPHGGTKPLASSLDWTAGQTVANAVTTKTGGGGIDVFNLSGSVDVVADISGYYR